MDAMSFAALFGDPARGPALRLPAAQGRRLSLPVFAVRGGRVFDALFLYPESGRPDAWALIDPGSGELAQFSLCAVEDFLDTAHWPRGRALDLEIPAGEGERADLLARYAALYDAARPFAFAPQPSPEQDEARRELGALLVRLTPPAQLSCYAALSPGLFEWLGLEEDKPPAVQEPPAAPPAPDLGPIYETLQGLLGLFRDKIARDEHKDRLFDEMHAELQQHKNGLLEMITRPLEEDVIHLIDDVTRTMEHHRGRAFSPDNYRRLLTLFEGVRTDLIDLLYRHGIEPFRQEGDEVEVGRQKILSTVPAPGPELDRRIAERLADGWEKNGRVIRPERVTVYLWDPDAAEDDDLPPGRDRPPPSRPAALPG